MIRQTIYEMCNAICPTYGIGQIAGTLKEDTFILERNMDLISVGNSLGGWNRWSVYIYSPKSPLQVDILAETLKKAVNINGYELINIVEGDNWDSSYKCYFTRLTFRTPKTIN